MSVTVEQIDLWRSLPTETPQLEFKTARNQFDGETLFEYCVAIANEGGGHLLLGIRDAKPRDVIGSQAFPNPGHTAERIFQAVGFRVDVEEVNHPDGRVVVFIIPSRPHGTAYQHRGKYLMRCGESLVPMTEDQLRKIFAEGEPDWIEEYSMVGLTEQRVAELIDARTFVHLLGLPTPLTDESAIERLIENRLIDRTPAGLAIRRIGALLGARRIIDFPDVARKAPRVIVYRGSSKLDTLSSYEGQLGYALAFTGLVKYVTDRLPQNEILEEAIRKQVTLVPGNIIRELLANALIHQDLRMTGTSVMIEIYADRIDISNPGEPLLPVKRFIDGCQSRNERLASLMRKMGMCEEKGSGIDRVIHTVEMYQLPAPDFRAEYNRTSVVIFGPKPFDELDQEARIRACYHHCCLNYVTNSNMTNQSLRKRFKLPSNKAAIVSQVITAAIDDGYIKRDERVGDSRRYARYLPFWA